MQHLATHLGVGGGSEELIGIVEEAEARVDELVEFALHVRVEEELVEPLLASAASASASASASARAHEDLGLRYGPHLVSIANKL